VPLKPLVTRQRTYYEEYRAPLNRENAARYVAKRWRLLAGQPAAGTMLDLGCGEAILAGHFSARGFATVGLDLSFRRLRSAARVDPRGLFVAGLAEELPFADGSFDVVFANALLHHAADASRVLHEAVRVTRAGGVMAVVEPNPRNPAIALQASTNRAEWNLFRISFEHLVHTLEVDPRVEEVRAGSFNELFYPYRRFPGGRLRPHVARLETLLERLGFRTHRYALAKMRGTIPPWPISPG